MPASFFLSFSFLKIFIYLAVPGLSFGVQDLFFFFSSCSTPTLGCGMWDLIPWPGIKPGPLLWEWRVLATGPLGKSLPASFLGDWEFLWQDLFPTYFFFLSISFHCISLTAKDHSWSPQSSWNKIFPHFSIPGPFSRSLLTWSLLCFPLPKLEDWQTSFCPSLGAKNWGRGLVW